MLLKFILKCVGFYHVVKDSPQYKRFENVDEYCNALAAAEKISANSDSRSLDLGCGSEIRNPFNCRYQYGADISPSAIVDKKIRKADLALEPIPYPTCYFDVVTAHDFLEHIPRYLALFDPIKQEQFSRFAFVELMNEIMRVLKPGGLFLSVTPAFPFSVSFTDPTHVNHINEHTFPNYFCDQPIAKIYGFKGELEMVRQGWRGRYLISLMRKPKVTEGPTHL